MAYSQAYKDHLAKLKSSRSKTTPTTAPKTTGTVTYSSPTQANNSMVAGVTKPAIKPVATTSSIKPGGGTVIYSNQAQADKAAIPGIINTPPKTTIEPTTTLEPTTTKPLETEPLDYKALAKAEFEKYVANMPKYQEPVLYENPMTPAIMETLNRINTKTTQGFQFNPNDPALNQMQNQAIGKVREDMARRGRVFDTYAATREQEAAQRLLPEYYRLQRSDYDKDIQNLGNVLAQQTGLDKTNYGRFQDVQGQQRDLTTTQRQDYVSGLNYGQKEAEAQRKIALEDEKRIQQQEFDKYGMTLSPTMRSYEQAYYQLPQTEIARMMPYSANYAARINELMAIDPNHPDLPILQILRAMKVASDPQLLKMYGNEYGMQSGAINQMAQEQSQVEAQAQQQEILNQLEVMKGKIQNEKYITEIEKVQAEIQKIEAEAYNKDMQSVTEQYKALQEQIKTASLPSQLKADLDRVIAQAEQSRSSSAFNYERVTSERQGRALAKAEFGLKEQKYRTEQEQKQFELDVAKEKQRLVEENKDVPGIGLQDIYDTYNGDIKEFLKNEGAAYYRDEMEDIVDAYAKIEKLDKDDLFSALMGQALISRTTEEGKKTTNRKD